MSQSIDIFIRAKKPLADMAAEIASQTGLQLLFDGNDIYRHRDAEKHVYVHANDYHSEPGHPVKWDSYDHVLAIRTSPRAFQRELAESYFRHLKSSTKYALLMAIDQDEVIDQRD